MTAATAHALGFLLSRSVDQPALLTAEQAVQLNEAARNLCHYAIGEIAPNRWLLSAALTAICRTYEANPAVCRESISHCFGADHLRTHGYVELPILSHEAKWLLRADPALLKLLYEVAFEFEETSEQSTAMGGPVFALSFSRRQEVEQVRWELGQFFKTFLEVCPGLATQTLMAVLERDDARTRPASHRQRREYSFSFEGSTVWFVEDGSGFRGTVWRPGRGGRDAAALGRSHGRGGRKPYPGTRRDFEERQGGDLSGCGVAQVNASRYQEPSGY